MFAHMPVARILRLSSRRAVYEERVAGRALNQSAKRRSLVPSEDEVALPMAGDRAVSNLRRSFLNGEHVRYFPAPLLGVGVPALSAIGVLIPERFHQRAFELALRKHIPIPIYGFVRNVHMRIERILLFETLLYLSWRPLFAKSLEHVLPQTAFSSKAALAMPSRRRLHRRSSVGRKCAVPASPAVFANLAGYRGRASAEPSGEGSPGLRQRRAGGSSLHARGFEAADILCAYEWYYLPIRCVKLLTPPMKKIVVTVPVANADAVRQAIGEVCGGGQGNYSFCSFSARGIGRFKPGAGAHPTIGEVGKLEEVEEERIEVTCNDDHVANIVAAIRRVHPYEVPVIDVYTIVAG